jgi:hypothetical protein
MLTAIVGSILMLSVDAMAIRIPTKAIKKAFTEKAPKEHWHYNHGANAPRYHYNKEESEFSTGTRWYPYGPAIRNIHRIDSLYRDSLKKFIQQGGDSNEFQDTFFSELSPIYEEIKGKSVIDSKIDSLQKTFNNAKISGHGEAQNKKNDLHENERFDSEAMTENGILDVLTEKKWLIIDICAALLLLVAAVILFSLKKKKGGK